MEHQIVASGQESGNQRKTNLWKKGAREKAAGQGESCSLDRLGYTSPPPNAARLSTPCWHIQESGAKGSGGGENGVEAEVGPMEEGGEFGKAEGEALGGGRAEGDVAEFAAGAGGFAIEMEVGVGDGEDFGGFGEFAD